MTTAWTAEQRRQMHRAGISSTVLDRLQSMFDTTASDSKLDHIVSVEDYAENKILTTANFEAALIAAVDAAYALATEAYLPNSITIDCPAGEWPMTATLRIRARDAYAMCPRIRFPGSNCSRLVWAALPTGGTGPAVGACVWFDGTSDPAPRHISYGGLEGVLIDCQDTAATGIYGECLLTSQFRDVTVARASGTSALSGQTGVAASVAAADSVYETQVVTGLTGMTSHSVGRVLTISGATTSANNGTFLIVEYVSATSVKIRNASGTSDASNGALTWTEKLAGTGWRFRGSYTRADGKTVDNSQQLRMDSVGAQSCRIGWWLESIYPMTVTRGLSNQNSTHDWVLGNNVEMKWIGELGQSGHGGSMILQLPGAVGIEASFENVYHEGSVASVLKTFPGPSSVQANTYVLRNVKHDGCTTYIDANGTRSIIAELGDLNSAPTKWVKARNCENIELRGNFDPFIDQSYATTLGRSSKYDLDFNSYDGFSVRGQRREYSSQQIPQKSLNRLLIERDIAAEIWDPRVSAKCTVVAGELQAITGIVNGIVAGPATAGKYPTFQPSNANLGNRPTWTNVAGALGSGCELTATITSGALPAGSSPGILAVWRIPAGTQDATCSRQIRWNGGAGEYIRLVIADGFGSGIYGNMMPTSGNLKIKDPDALPQAGVICTSGSHLSGLQGNVIAYYAAADVITGTAGDRSAYSSSAGGNLHFGAGVADSTRTGALELAYVALIKRYLTHQELYAILDLMAAEWPGIARY